MGVTEIQAKVGHDSESRRQGTDTTFQMAGGVFVQSALILKKHGKSDDEIAAMLKTDFKLNDGQIQTVLKEMDVKGGQR